MVGNRSSKASRPVASSHRWSTRWSSMRRVMARATTSRGSSSSTKRSPWASRIRAPWPRSASDSSGRGISGWCSAVGWNCTNSTSATAAPARRAMAMPSPVLSTGLVVTEKSWPAPPVASSTLAARDHPHPAAGRRGRPRPGTARRSTTRSRANDVLVDRGHRAPHRLDQGPLDLGAGGGTAGVHDPGQAVAALAGQLEAALLVAVEHGPQRDQLVDPARALVDQHPHRVAVAQPGTGGQGVGQVQVGRVRVLAQHRGHATLGPAGGRLGQLALGQHARPACRGCRRPAPRPTGRPRRCPARAGRAAGRASDSGARSAVAVTASRRTAGSRIATGRDPVRPTGARPRRG